MLRVLIPNSAKEIESILDPRREEMSGNNQSHQEISTTAVSLPNRVELDGEIRRMSLIPALSLRLTIKRFRTSIK